MLCSFLKMPLMCSPQLCLVFSTICCETSIICLETQATQPAWVLCWHSPEAAVLCRPTRKYRFVSLQRCFPQLFIFYFCAAFKASCYFLGFILPLTLCPVRLRRHPDGLFLKLALSGKGVTVVTHQRKLLTWKDCKAERLLFLPVALRTSLALK